MTGRMDGKVALVTGGASGLGRETALLFAREGARVAVSDINAEGGRAVAAEIGDAALFLDHDVTSEAQWIEVIAKTVAAFGGLHVLVNSAGIGLSKSVEDTELEEWRRVFLETGRQGLKVQSRDPGERELIRTRAKLGELTMRMELATELLEKRGYGDELKRLLKRGHE